MRSPRHLWTGEWRSESERAREAADEAAALRKPERPEATAGGVDDVDAGERAGAPRGRGSFVLTLVLGALALAGIAFAAGMLLEGGTGSGGPSALPAIASKPVKPHHGQTRAGAIYAAVSPAVVSIRTDEGEGTGFLIDRNGTLVTNDHVVAGSTHVVVHFGVDGDALGGDVLGTDPSTDLAVVSIDPAQIPQGATPLKFADSREVQIGDLAIAIGNPLGLDRTATEGIVSALGRTIQSPNGFSINDVIQTDAPINPGNSGGPLLDASGHVIGINAQIATAGTNGSIGIGFAVPSNTARQVVPLLEQGRRVPHAWLGLRDGPTSATSPDGAKVVQIFPGSPAEHAGVRVGDIIKRVGEAAVQTPEDVATAVGDHKPGEQVDVVVERGGSTLTLHAKLGKQPTRTP
ncbi:MAG TPA: trypsin-like peptidase domain-containing protein [Conexibacter sp.]|nr:trypsin-like peptidase domain-containing protein [Conexibacter sp.]